MDEQSPKQEEPTPETSSKKPGILPGKRVVLPGALYWFMEFLVVFAGVFGAFLLSEFRTIRAEQKQRELTKQALISEISEVTQELRSDDIQGLELFITRFDSLVQEGAEPDFVVPITGSAGGKAHFWETAKSTGALSLFDTETVLGLSGFYSNTDYLMRIARRWQDMTLERIQPHVGGPKEEFYDPTTNELRERYAWYPQLVRSMVWQADNIAQYGDSLLAVLNGEEQ